MNNRIKSFEDLEIWKLSHSLTIEIYTLVRSFPAEEKYILAKQLIRSSQSIPANIAEGMGRFSQKEFLQFLIIARGFDRGNQISPYLGQGFGFYKCFSIHKIKGRLYSTWEKN